MVKASVDKADEQRHYSATVNGGLKGGAMGLGGSLAAGAIAHRAGVRAVTGLTLPLKAFGVTAATVATFIIGADHAGRKYELAQYQIGSGTALSKVAHQAEQAEQQLGLDRYARRPQAPGENASTSEALLAWGTANKYKVVFGAWAASMVGSFGYISMTPMTFTQKLVQARMIAQGLTVGVLIASAGLGLSEKKLELQQREDMTYRWKKDSPHALQHQKELAEAQKNQ